MLESVGLRPVWSRDKARLRVPPPRARRFAIAIGALWIGICSGCYLDIETDIVCAANEYARQDHARPGRVVVSVTSAKFFAICVNWARNMQRIGLMNWFLVAIDPMAWHAGKELGLPIVCEPVFCVRGLKPSKGQIWQYRMHIMLRLTHGMEEGATFVMSDSDAVWERDAMATWIPPMRNAPSTFKVPTLHHMRPAEQTALQEAWDQLTVADVLAQAAHYPPNIARRFWPYTLCMGLAAIRVNSRTRSLTAWMMSEHARKRHGAHDDQVALNGILYDKFNVTWRWGFLTDSKHMKQLPGFGVGQAPVAKPEDSANIPWRHPPRSLESDEITPPIFIGQDMDAIRLFVFPYEVVQRDCSSPIYSEFRASIRHCDAVGPVERKVETQKIAFLVASVGSRRGGNWGNAEASRKRSSAPRTQTSNESRMVT